MYFSEKLSEYLGEYFYYFFFFYGDQFISKAIFQLQ